MNSISRHLRFPLILLVFGVAVLGLPSMSLTDGAFSVTTAIADETTGDTKTTEAKPVKPPEPEGSFHLRNARSTMAHFLESARASDWTEAAKCLDFSGLEDADKKGLAWKLKEILDRLEVIDLEAISDDPADVWGHSIDLKAYSQRPLSIEQGGDELWRFNQDSVKRINELYELLKDEEPVAGHNRLRDLFPGWMTRPGFLLPHYQWICLLIIIFVGIVVDHLFRFVLWRMTYAWFRFRRIDTDEKLERGLWKPVGLLVRALVWYGGMVVIDLRPDVLMVLRIAVEFFAIISAVWTAFRFIDLLSSYLSRKALSTDTKYDDLLVPLVSRSLKIFVVCVATITFAQASDWPIAGLLSGMGLGGVAVAFAAKDTVGNVFGSLTVLTDRPFEIGDWIVTDKAEGTVETVGIRSTRIRTFYNSLVTLPNSLLMTAAVDNMGRRRYRRIKTTLGIQYDTPPERIEAFCEAVRELLRRHPYTRKDYYHVYLNQMSESSLDILLYCFVECPDWGVELRERHRLLLDILRVARELGVSFAFPTRTLHMFQEEYGPGDVASPVDSARAGRMAAARVAGPVVPRAQRPGLVEYLGPIEETGDDGEGGEG